MNGCQWLLKGLLLGLITFLLSSCGVPHDLDTPCPDYGRQCSQALINV